MLRWLHAGLILTLLWIAPQQMPADESAAAQNRLPVPDKVEVGKALEALAQQFADKLRDKSDAGRADLAEALFDFADRKQGDEVRCFAACDKAYEIAIELGYPILMGRAASRLATRYQNDKSELLARGYERMIADNHSALVYRDVAREAVAQARRLKAGDDFRGAKRLTELAVKSAVKAKSKQAQRTAEAADAEMAACHRLAAESDDAQTTLAEKPDDPAANLAVGSYQCFVKQQWDTGLPMLAKGSDAKLAVLAKRTLETKQANATNHVITADEWWSLAAEATQPRRDAMESYAIAIYFRALPELTGHEPDRIVVLLRNWIAKHPASPAVAAIMASINGEAPAVAAAPSQPAPQPAPRPAPGNPPAGGPQSSPVSSSEKDYPPLEASIANYIARRIAQRQTSDTECSGSGKSEFRDVAEEGGVLVAFVIYWQGEYERAAAIEPIFRTAKGIRHGKIHGSTANIAHRGSGLPRIGHAVSGMTFADGRPVEGARLTFMRIMDQKLDSSQRSASRVRGGQPDSPIQFEVGNNGSFVVGITGKLDSNGVLSGLGLVTLQ